MKMKFEHRGRSLGEAVARATAKPLLSTKGSDSDSATVRSGNRTTLRINVHAREQYTVTWSAKAERESVYLVDIFTDAGMGSHQESFASSGSWSFNTRDYEGPVEIVIFFEYAAGRLRTLDVEVG